MLNQETEQAIVNEVKDVFYYASVAVQVAKVFVGVMAKIQIKLREYSESHTKRMAALQNAYSNICYEKERSSSLSTIEPNAQDKLPIYFMMDPDSPKLPKFYSMGLYPNTDQLDWQKKVADHGLRPSIQGIIAYICEYQNARDEYITRKLIRDNMSQVADYIQKKCKGDAPRYYDPINLFCEEFKRWLVALSAVKLDKDASEKVKLRIMYLSKIYTNSEVFAEENIQTPFLPMVERLRTLLANDVIKRIDMAISQTGAREHFEAMKSATESLILNGVQLLFYIFRKGERKHIPKNFVPHQLREPTLVKYEIVLETVSGKLLQHLVSKSLLAELFPAISGTSIAEQALAKGDETVQCNFINSKGKPIFPFAIGTVNEDNWYALKGKDLDDPSYKTGILREFRKKDLMDDFLLLHGLLEKLGLFYQICDEIYSLTGDIGNLILYGYIAGSQIERVLEKHDELIEKIKQTVGRLGEAAKKYYNQHTKNENRNPTWAEVCYKRFDEADQNISQSLKESLDHKAEIRNLIQKINHPDYSETVKRKLQSLLQSIKVFVEETPKQQETRYQVRHFENQTALFGYTPKDKVLNDLLNKAMKLINEKKYEEFIGAANVLLTLEKREDMRLKLYSSQLLAYTSLIKNNKEFYKELLQVTDSIIDLKPAANHLMQVLFLKAQVLYNAGEIDGAKESLNKLLEMNKNHNEAHVLLNEIGIKTSSKQELS